MLLDMKGYARIRVEEEVRDGHDGFIVVTGETTSSKTSYFMVC